MIYSNLDRTALDAAIAIAPAYYTPLLITARDLGLSILSVPQHAWPFSMPTAKGSIVAIIGDDTYCAFGPTGFDRRSMVKLFKWADIAIVVACAPCPSLYATAATFASCLGLKVVLIETRLTKEHAWISFASEANGDIRMMIGTAAGGTA